MAAIRQWMNTEKTNDPKGSVIPNKAEEDDEDEEDDADCLEDKKKKRTDGIQTPQKTSPLACSSE